MDSIKMEIMLVFAQILHILVCLTIPLATLKLAWAALQKILGHQDAAVEAIRGVIVGIILMASCKTIAWIIQLIAEGLNKSHPVGM